jgi:glycyl-tRNA synthetase
MSSSVFEASGHLTSFADPIVRCTKCKSTHRADRIISELAKVEIPESADLEEFDKVITEKNIKCPKCNGNFENTKKFNMMFQVGIGPEGEPAYLRPETCQSIFVDFPRLFKTMRGIQVNDEVKALTCKEAVDSQIIPNKFVAYYLGILAEFYEKTGVNMKKSRFRKLGEKEKAFYAEVAYDFEVETTTGWLELVACNYRSDYDLGSHGKKSKEKFEVMDGDEKVLPHIFELSMGIDRSMYTILEHSLREDKEHDRMVLSLKPYLSPIHVGVLSLVKKDGLAEKTDEIYLKIKRKFDVFLDHSGAIGRRYRRLDEVGAPFAITIDHQTLQDDTVTLRMRDSMEQNRIKISELDQILSKETAFP